MPDCPGCDNPNCNGKMETLRRFASWKDLSYHAGEETIVGWINELAERRQVTQPPLHPRKAFGSSRVTEERLTRAAAHLLGG